MTVREAYIKWQNTLNKWTRTCCNQQHEYINNLGLLMPKEDDQVCERERAWRQYVRLRDESPNFPFETIFH